MRRAGVLVLLVTALVLGTAAAALAISDGVYSYDRQHCSAAANSTATEDEAEEGCTNFAISLKDGAGNEPFFFGFKQTPDGTTVDPTDPIIATGTAFDPATGAFLYLGADDNLNVGEHDGSPLINNGPSDGGAIVLNADPAALDAWVVAFQAADVAYLLTHPLPIVDGGLGACADGICVALSTVERVGYLGGNPAEPAQPVADYSGKEWDPETCAGPSDGAADCGGNDITFWHNKDGVRTVQPGVQIYEDPDPQGSPLGPYPLPALYVGTCGVILGGGPSGQVPASPVTNSADQLHVGTACG